MRLASGIPRVLVGVVLLSAGSCDGITDPVPSYGEIKDFYAVSGEPQAKVVVDPRYLTLQTRLFAPDLVQKALGCSPTVCRFTDTGLAFQYYIELRDGTDAEGAEAAARALRLTPGVDFASAIYRLVSDSTCIIALFNSLTVQFKAGVSADSIERINAVVGTTLDPDRGIYDTYQPLRYGVGASHSPLEVVAYYGRNRGVEGVSPMATGCFDGTVF
jgi:hypothetical protein